MTFEIYMVENLKTGKIYIGKTTQGLKRRKSCHECVEKRLTHLERSIRKYGRENFKWNVIFNCLNEKEMNRMEKEFIAIYNAQYELYNHSEGGEGGNTFSLLSEKDKLKRVERYKGKNNPMHNKSMYDVWVNKYGIEEADRRLKEFKNKCKEHSKRMWANPVVKEKMAKRTTRWSKDKTNCKG